VPQLDEKRGGSFCKLLYLEEGLLQPPLTLDYLGMKVTERRGEDPFTLPLESH